MSFGLLAGGPVIPNFGEGSRCVTENRVFCPDWVRDNWHSTQIGRAHV